MTMVLGIDIGTTATKVAVVDLDGAVVAEGVRTNQLISPHAGWAEEDPNLWWRNICELCASLPTKEVGAIGVSGMVPCVIPLDRARRHLRRSIQQSDARAHAEVRELAGTLNDADLLPRTGSSLTHQSVAPTALWLARNEPQVWAQTAAIVGSYDYITSRLTDVVIVERNWALESGLFDIRTEDWAPDICEAGGIDPALMPPVALATDVVGEVTAEAARSTGLTAGTPVIAGSADHVAAALAAGVVGSGQVLVKLGGAGDVLLASAEVVVDRRLYLDYHLVPRTWLPNGCMAASGSFIEWFARELAGGIPLAQLDREAQDVPAGARGIVALPYLLGEKTPIHDPQARGVFYGLHLGHRRADMFRAVLEAVAYGFRHHFEVFDDLGYEVATVRVGDGGASSPLFTSVISNVLGRSLEPVLSRSGSALGVAFTAGIGAGLIADWDAISRFVSLGPRIEPDPATNDVYAEGYGLYRALYTALRPLLERPATDLGPPEHR